MSETSKKRKAPTQASETPSKKPQTAASVTVRHIDGPDIAKPVVATTPGVSFPSGLKFDSFSRSKRPGPAELLLHSSDHPTIEYTAVESSTANSTEKHLKHYIAVFDPATADLRVTEAKRMSMRSVVRQLESAEDSEEEIAPITNYSSRAALTKAFGTKKSKKAVQSIAENRLLAHASDDGNSALANAILSTVDKDDSDSLEAPFTQRSSKPLPAADLETGDITQVYAHSTLVFPSPAASTLNNMPLAYWCDRFSQRKEIRTSFRFIASRVGHLGKAYLASPEDGALQRDLQLLRYIQLLLEVAKYVRSLPPHKRLPPPSRWPPKTTSDNILPEVQSGIYEHFFPNALPTTHAVTLLQTTILALTLHVPPPSRHSGEDILATEPTDIGLDLALDRVVIHKLYKELGCRIEAAKERELERWGLAKVLRQKAKLEDGTLVPKLRFAKLRFPLKWPKTSVGRAKAKR